LDELLQESWSRIGKLDLKSRGTLNFSSVDEERVDQFELKFESF
jgi:hypothetical protein